MAIYTTLTKRAYVFRTNFADNRSDYHDIISAASAAEAEREATRIIRGVDELGYGVDESAEVEIICEIASDPATIAEDMLANPTFATIETGTVEDYKGER